VYTTFWADPKVLEEFTPEDKLFYLYLLTNEYANQIGIYQITKKQMAFEIGYSTESINALLQRFVDHHKVVEYNQENREIFIKNWAKYNLSKGGKPVIDCVKKDLETVKTPEFIEKSIKLIMKPEIQVLFIQKYESLTNRDTNRTTISGQKEKQTQKQTQKEKQTQNGYSLIDEEFGKVVRFYEENFGPLSPFVGEELDLLTKSYPSELVLEAFKETRLNQTVRKPLNFANTILRNWHSENIKSLHDLEMKRKRGEKNGTTNQTTPKEYSDGVNF